MGQKEKTRIWFFVFVAIWNFFLYFWYYYGSISEKLFKDALDWAKEVSIISDVEYEAILACKKTFLSDGVNFWRKKGENSFNIAMGAFDGAEATDIVGLFLLNKMKKVQSE